MMEVFDQLSLLLRFTVSFGFAFCFYDSDESDFCFSEMVSSGFKRSLFADVYRGLFVFSIALFSWEDYRRYDKILWTLDCKSKWWGTYRLKPLTFDTHFYHPMKLIPMYFYPNKYGFRCWFNLKENVLSKKSFFFGTLAKVAGTSGKMSPQMWKEWHIQESIIPR